MSIQRIIGIGFPFEAFLKNLFVFGKGINLFFTVLSEKAKKRNLIYERRKTHDERYGNYSAVVFKRPKRT